jgi:serine/threonine protein kinase
MTDRPINALPEGIELDGYVFGDVLGRGGFGITYRAEEKLSGRPVAIKEYFPGDIVARIGASATVRPISNQLAAGFRAGREKFIDEARIIARLNHPGVVRVLRVFEANATAYYVMEFETGETLAQRLAGGPLSEAALRPLLAALLDGLDAVHRANVLHRDIKPSNILVLPRRRAQADRFRRRQIRSRAPDALDREDRDARLFALGAIRRRGPARPLVRSLRGRRHRLSLPRRHRAAARSSDSLPTGGT